MVFFIGVLVSFLGQLPIGYINLIAVKIATEKSVSHSMKFSFGIALVEVLYVAIIIYCFSSFLANPDFFKSLQVITAIAFFVIGIIIIYKWKQNPKAIKLISNKTTHNSFVFGLIISATNIVQFPFWIIWVSYLTNLRLLVSTSSSNDLFIIGTGFGTLLGLFLYIFIGKLLVNKYKRFAKYLNLVIAICLLLAAGFQMYNFFVK